VSGSWLSRRFAFGDIIMVVVGDKAKYYDEVAALGFDIIEVGAF